MSSCGWKLSSALIVALAMPVQAQGLNVSYADAMYCTMIAATVYAETTEENADSVSRASIQRCWSEWKVASEEISAKSTAEFEAKIGRKLTQAEFNKIGIYSAADENVFNEVRMKVIDWRSQAKVGHEDVFRIERDLFREKRERNKLSGTP